MESFKQYLLTQMINDEIISEEQAASYEEDDNLSVDTLFQDTDLEPYDLENYVSQFREHCNAMGVSPDWDVEDLESAIGTPLN